MLFPFNRVCTLVVNDMHTLTQHLSMSTVLSLADTYESVPAHVLPMCWMLVCLSMTLGLRLGLQHAESVSRVCSLERLYLRAVRRQVGTLALACSAFALSCALRCVVPQAVAAAFLAKVVLHLALSLVTVDDRHFFERLCALAH
ncbi:hypothetical protein sr12146 [Sporisorium reilianum SRZ2]|uniref:Uncharacterized protein n=1 Tax=Sporisorium reilianum (strain SRZ2) TaxID=999809 RepID=E6ZSP1_SPORE|nr:hypothetical protein sr12146 [Sporisorium reilianum SRZ2]